MTRTVNKSPEALAEARRLYGEGLRLPAIATRLGMSTSYLHRLLVLEGKWQARPVQGVHGAEADRILHLLRKGLTYAQIMAETGRSRTAIRRLANAEGLRPTQCRSKAPGRRLVLTIGEGASESVRSVWCAAHGEYVPVAEAVRSSKSRTGFAGICRACNRAKTCRYRGRRPRRKTNEQ